MGIPLFFKYVRQTQPHLLNRLSIRTLTEGAEPAAGSDGTGRGRRRRQRQVQEQEQPRQSSCDCLYLDFNCAVHRCARVVAELRRQHRDGDGEQRELEDEVIRESCEFVRKMVRALRPRRYLYVAVDGMPPLAKMMQQRSRRYMSAMIAGGGGREDEHAAAERWDSNCVTPGTDFMARLDAALRKLKTSLRRDAVYKVPDVCVSCSSEPGEGEQKITQEIRRLSRQRGEGEAEAEVFIYGLDADLLLLGALCADVCRVSIFRPSDRDSPKPGTGLHDDIYFAVDVSHFKRHIHSRMGASDERQSVLDYVVLCSLMGNDFVPGLACLPVGEDSVNALIDGYHSATASSKEERRCLTSIANGERIDVDRGILAAVLDSLVPGEERRVHAADTEYYSQCDAQRRQPGGILDLDKYGLSHPFPRDLVRPGDGGWRLRYYRHLFRNGDDADVVAKACVSFLEGLVWSVNYHVLGPSAASMTWAYPHGFAPTAVDVANHLSLCSSETLPHPAGAAVGPQHRHPSKKGGGNQRFALPASVQLLLVLPLESLKRYADPETVRRATALEGGCAHLFPVRFRVLTYLKRYASECVPLTPAVDEHDLRRLCELSYAQR